jgi:dihydroorotase
MNEGIKSTQLGLPGKPMIAEEIPAARDLSLLSYTESRLHMTGISSPKTIEGIQKAKADGNDISCSVTPAHLFFTDEDLGGYDTNLKIFPPLRTADVQAELKKAVLNGSIDCIASHHIPHEYDSKVCEFDHAEPGMIALETAYAATQTALGNDLTPEKWVKLACDNPRNIFGLTKPVIDINQPTNITLFDPSLVFTFTANNIRSKSSNSPFVGKELKGKVIGTILNQHLHINGSTT